MMMVMMMWMLSRTMIVDAVADDGDAVDDDVDAVADDGDDDASLVEN